MVAHRSRSRLLPCSPQLLGTRHTGGTEQSPGRDPMATALRGACGNPHHPGKASQAPGCFCPCTALDATHEEQLTAGNTAFPGRVTVSTATSGNCFCLIQSIWLLPSTAQLELYSHLPHPACDFCKKTDGCFRLAGQGQPGVKSLPVRAPSLLGQ